MRKLRLTIALLAVLGPGYGAGLASRAAAAGLPPAVADCEVHGRLTRNYSAAELRAALDNMPADVKEYSNCPNVIEQALLAKVGPLSGGGPGGGGGSFLPVWVIAVLAVVLVAGAASALALRNRRDGG